MVYHIDERLLFTGDTLHWNHRRGEMDVFPRQTFYSWATLADTMDRLATLPVEWVFAGHGMWRNIGAQEWKRQMAALGPAMRRTGTSILVGKARYHLWMVLTGLLFNTRAYLSPILISQ